MYYNKSFKIKSNVRFYICEYDRPSNFDLTNVTPSFEKTCLDTVDYYLIINKYFDIAWKSRPEVSIWNELFSAGFPGKLHVKDADNKISR